MTWQDQPPGCGRAGHERACHTSKSHPRLAQLTFPWGLLNLRRGMQNAESRSAGWGGGGLGSCGGVKGDGGVGRGGGDACRRSETA